MLKKSRWRQAALALFLIFLLLLTLKNAEYTANGIKKGLVLFGTMLLPSLLPFLVLSELFLSTGSGVWLGRVLARPLRFLFGLTEQGAAALLLGWLCGVPVGAVYAMQLLRRGAIDQRELGRLLLLANTPSTGFLVGAVGISLFGSREVGLVLLLATLAAGVITGVFLKIIKGNLTPACGIWQANGGENSKFSTALTTAVKNSATTLLTVCSFVLFFAAVSECVRVAAVALSLPPLVATLITGTLELSAGVSAATAAHTPGTALVLCALFSGFSGLSIALQIFTVTDGRGIGLLPYLAAKALQGLLAAGLTLAYLNLRRPVLTCTKLGFLELDSALYRVPIVTWHALLVTLFALFLLPPLWRYRTVRFYKLK